MLIILVSPRLLNLFLIKKILIQPIAIPVPKLLNLKTNCYLLGVGSGRSSEFLHIPYKEISILHFKSSWVLEI